MNGAAKVGYARLPILNRVGAGSYTYQFIIEGGANVERYEIFANCNEDAVCASVMITGHPVYNWAWFDSDTIEVAYGGYPFRCFLYIQ